MKVKVRFVGYLARKFGEERGIELDDRSTLGDAIREVIRKGEAGVRGSVLSSTRIFLNGRTAGMDTLLKDGDEISFFPIIAGG